MDIRRFCKLIHSSVILKPFIVVRQAGPSNCLVKRQGEEEMYEVHVSSLKPYVARQPDEQKFPEEETELENTASDDQPKVVPNPPTDGVKKSSLECKNTARSVQSPVVSNSTSDGVEEPSPEKN